MEQVDLNELVKIYTLPKKEHDVILEQLKQQVFGARTSTSHPSALLVVGQPGCGKTTFIAKSNLSDYTIINSDDYRCCSIFSNDILDKYPTYYARLTNYDAHKWGDELFAYGIQNGYSVLREKAPLDDSLIESNRELAEMFDFGVCVVTTGNLTSLLATRERYERALKKGEKAKLSDIKAHNDCYDHLPDFVSRCLELGIQVCFAKPVGDTYELTTVGNDAVDELNAIREESNREAAKTFEIRMSAIEASMRGRNAPKEQFDGLDEIRKIYENFKNATKVIGIETEEPEIQ